MTQRGLKLKPVELVSSRFLDDAPLVESQRGTLFYISFSSSIFQTLDTQRLLQRCNANQTHF
jgi:hypothetical protein